jgi:hypothetical protein
MLYDAKTDDEKQKIRTTINNKHLNILKDKMREMIQISMDKEKAYKEWVEIQSNYIEKTVNSDSDLDKIVYYIEKQKKKNALYLFLEKVLVNKKVLENSKVSINELFEAAQIKDEKGNIMKNDRGKIINSIKLVVMVVKINDWLADELVHYRDNLES